MSDQYPSLTSMGIHNPNQITHYTVYQSRSDTDILKISYARPKGSFLPVTRSYKFGREPKSQLVDSGSRKTVTLYEMSTLLVKATEELDKIVRGKKSRSELKQQISQEIERIQGNFLDDIAGLKQLLSKLDQDDK